jgi:very-short-patch-repair endonuclease
MSAIEETFALHIRAHKLPEPVREHKFDAIRKWRFDFAWPDLMIAVEIEGGTWSGGRHTRGAGFENDCIKYNAATSQGWAVYRFTSKMIESGQAIKSIVEITET